VNERAAMFPQWLDDDIMDDASNNGGDAERRAVLENGAFPAWNFRGFDDDEENDGNAS